LLAINNCLHLYILLRWKPGDFLGQGSFGKVTLGLNIETGEMMAVKQVDIQCVRSNNEVSFFFFFLNVSSSKEQQKKKSVL
jgi:hypothetical protein